MSDHACATHLGGGGESLSPPPPPRPGPFQRALYGTLTLVLSPLLVMVNVPAVVLGV
jgi:hypothetical protein